MNIDSIYRASKSSDFDETERTSRKNLSQKFNVNTKHGGHRKRVHVLRPIYETICSYEQDLSDSDSDEDCIDEMCEVEEIFADAKPQLEDNVASKQMQQYLSYQYKGISKQIKKIMKWRPMGKGRRYYVSLNLLEAVLQDIQLMRQDPEGDNFELIDADSIYTV